MEKRIGDVTLEVTIGDITDQPDVDAIVNAANADLRMGGGVAGAIHRAAGPGLAEESAPLAPIRPGQCVMTGGHRLPNPHVIHCLGPVYGVDEPSPDLLAACYARALEIADQAGLRSVAFPAISTGAFGYPVEDAARVAVRSISQAAAELGSVRLIRMVLHADRDLEAHLEALEETPGP
ncbi:MAG TPA: macro domain-containing protein [Actinomycetota bacterium]|nr:macro domain-containing protein [Actinomycetota bacterium]